MSLSGFEMSAYILTFFLTGFGILFLYLSTQVPPPEKTGVGSLMLGKLLFLLFALLYIALAHFTLYAGINIGMNEASLAPCGNLLNSSTDINSTTTVYQFVNNCADREPSASTTSFFTLFTWILYLDLLALAIGSMYLFARALSKW